MNDERFIELLNLYIDRELSPAGARELEDAIAASPERQRIYGQYCKMSRACQHLLAPPVKAPKPSIEALVAAALAPDEDDRVIAFPAAPTPAAAAAVVRTGSGSTWGWGMATGMMAACAAFAIYLGTSRLSPSSASTASTDSAPAGTTVAASAAPSTAPIGIDDNANGQTYRTVFVLDSQPGSPRGRLVATRSEGDPFAWMNQMTFDPIQPVQLDALDFQSSKPMEARTLSAFAYPYPGLDDTPPISASAAFQFQR